MLEFGHFIKETGLLSSQLWRSSSSEGSPGYVACRSDHMVRQEARGTQDPEGLNPGFCTCKAGALLLEPLLQFILLWVFWRWGLVNYLSRLALNCDPLQLSLPSS
jgi:hypothetical protein